MAQWSLYGLALDHPSYVGTPMVARNIQIDLSLLPSRLLLVASTVAAWKILNAAVLVSSQSSQSASTLLSLQLCDPIAQPPSSLSSGCSVVYMKVAVDQRLPFLYYLGSPACILALTRSSDLTIIPSIHKISAFRRALPERCSHVGRHFCDRFSTSYLLPGSTVSAHLTWSPYHSHPHPNSCTLCRLPLYETDVEHPPLSSAYTATAPLNNTLRLHSSLSPLRHTHCVVRFSTTPVHLISHSSRRYLNRQRMTGANCVEMRHL